MSLHELKAWLLVSDRGEPAAVNGVPVYWSLEAAQYARDQAGPRATREDWRIVTARVSWQAEPKRRRVQL